MDFKGVDSGDRDSSASDSWWSYVGVVLIYRKINNFSLDLNFMYIEFADSTDLSFCSYSNYKWLTILRIKEVLMIDITMLHVSCKNKLPTRVNKIQA